MKSGAAAAGIWTVTGGAQAAQLNATSLSLVWGIPFAGMLLSIALLPLLAAHFWHQHFGKVTAGWALAFLLPFALVFGMGTAVENLVHALLAEYFPFVILLAALYTVAGGIYVRGNLRGSPGLNTGVLALGAVLASFMGTTGASMLLIRPLLRANDDRRHQAHVVVFFIFIVSNAGGALTPLGDPPLFLGFLKGVDFFWTLRHLWGPALFMNLALLGIFYLLDRYLMRKADETVLPDPTPTVDVTGSVSHLGFKGKINFALLLLVVGLVLMSGLWRTPAGVEIFGTHVGLPGLVRDLGLIVVALLSLKLTPRGVHAANEFGWAPMQEVAKLFIGIFLTIIPVIAMLKAGADGPFGFIVRAVTRSDGSPDETMYFWVTGVLSSFLDNAPTYLVFFNTAGGDPAHLMTDMALTLMAISAGAVFMGANTYIGNAPNLMVKAIAEDRGVNMPGFFGYMIWSVCVLLPLLVIMTLIWFR
ncbi:sodium:proton antiporter [Comamonas aquatilis]|uniref:sodium:proton antiporter n=1 Tax=Comamonas aquatilis TaxID=1778406 RepID=UPI0039F09451